MKIEREKGHFKPISITFETGEEWKNFKTLIRASESTVTSFHLRYSRSGMPMPLSLEGMKELSRQIIEFENKGD